MLESDRSFIQPDWCHDTKDATRRDMHGECYGKARVMPPQAKELPEAGMDPPSAFRVKRDSANTSVSDFRPLDCETIFLMVRSLIWWHLGMTALPRLYDAEWRWMRGMAGKVCINPGYMAMGRGSRWGTGRAGNGCTKELASQADLEGWWCMAGREE